MKSRRGLAAADTVGGGLTSLNLHESEGTTEEIFVMKMEEQPLVNNLMERGMR